MPFTPTHVLAVLPVFFIFYWLPLSALAIGAMVPDLPMFLPLSSYNYSHTIEGVVTFCVPMGLIVYYLFENTGKQFIIELSPEWAKSRLSGYRAVKSDRDITNLILIITALIIGSVTHILWDAFTHKTGWGVGVYPWLGQNIAIFGLSLPIYKTIQYGSTLIGLPLLLMLGIYYLRKIKPEEPSEAIRFTKTMRYAVIISFCLIPGVIGFYNTQNITSYYTIIGATIKESIGVGLVLFFMYASIYWWYSRDFLRIK